MAKLNKDDFKIRYELFDKYALKDQRAYYNKTIRRSNNASRQVNFIRATLALCTGIAAALAATLAQVHIVPCANGGECNPTMELVIVILIIISILLPAVGGFFSSLADLYQWERNATIYDSAKRNLIVADAMSPREGETFEEYVANLQGYVAGTLQVMNDETAQWGQAIHEPEMTTVFIDQARKRAQELGGDASSGQEIGFVDNDDNSTAT